MTLNQLEYFCAVCRYQNITRAAKELYISQPTISVAIRELENELHLRLFRHEKNRISLTREGEEFYQEAEKLLAESHELKARFSQIGDRNVPLKIGIPPVLSTIFFPKLLKGFWQNVKTSVQLFEYGSVRAYEMVDSGQLDAAIGNLDYYNINHFSYHVFRDEPYVFCVHNEHPLAKNKQVTFEMISSYPIILFNTDSVQNRTVEERFHAHDITPDILMYSSQLHTILDFVKHNLAGAFLFASIPMDDPSLVCLPLEPAITSRIGIVWKKGVFQEERTAKFIQYVKGCYG